MLRPLILLCSLVFCLQALAAEFYFPVGNQDIKPQPSGFPNLNGYVVTQAFGGTSFHTGVDLANGSEGGAVRSIAAGTVVSATCVVTDSISRTECSGFGNVLVIRHDLPVGTFYSLYGHMLHGSLRVGVGDPVFAGQIVGEVNCTGATSGSSVCESNGGTGSHLHFEIKRSNERGCGYATRGCPALSSFEGPLGFIQNQRSIPSISGAQFLRFNEGNLGVAGDGRVIRSGRGIADYTFERSIGFDESQLIGSTATVFPASTSWRLDAVFVANRSCVVDTRSLSRRTISVVVNGISGYAIVSSPAEDEEYYSLVRASCGADTPRSAVEWVGINLRSPSTGQPVNLDAFAYGMGEMNTP